MRCALVIPSWNPEDIFPSRTATSQLNYWQPLGTLYVAAALRQAGHEVCFINGAFADAAEVVARTEAFGPDLVGIYATTFGWPRAMACATRLRQRLPGAFLITGGPYPMALRQECLDQCPALDAVVTGEGEETMVELCQLLAVGRPLDGCNGLAWRRGGRPVCNPDRPLLSDLDRLPFPARDLLGDEAQYLPPPATYRRKPVAVMLTSRGCDGRCIYCFQMDKSRKSGIRYRSVKNVLDEMEALLAQGYREIKFIDDTLAADYDRAMALCDGIRQRGLDVTWFASACVRQVDRALLQAFRQAGCWAVLMGAESGVQKNLNTLKKGITTGQIRRAVGWAKEAGLTVFTPFLIGIPGETYDEALATIDFACSLDPHVANFHALTPFPGTELHDRLAEWGSCSADLNDYTYQGAAFVPHTMTREQIGRLRQIAFRRFYSRPRFLFRQLARLRSLADLRLSCRGLVTLFWLWCSRDLFQRHRSSRAVGQQMLLRRPRGRRAA